MIIKSFIVEKTFEDSRIDIFLAKQLEGYSRSYIQELIQKGNVSVCGKVKKSNYKLKENETIDIEIPDLVPLEILAEDIPIEVMYEDNDVLVVLKPQGMVVHPAVGNYSHTLVNAVLNICDDLSGINGVIRPGIVHRIDKDTAGILVIAKNDNSHNKLSEQLKNHSMNRVYYALVEGIIKNDEGTIDANVGRHPRDRIKMAVVKEGKRAVTHYKVLERFRNTTLIECKLETGRTHQIRVHFANAGHPLVGDEVYGLKKQRFSLKGQMLFAAKLGFIHPVTGQYMEFKAELPEYFEKVLNTLRKDS